MTEPNWGLIRSGATFESLVLTILRFKLPGTVLFGRRGVDGGQDAKSKNGMTVFQAKHHESESAATAIRDAKKEAKRIKEHRQEGAPRYEQWKSVTHWCLITNCAFNPTDDHTWKTEVVPLFADLGLEAEYWGQAALNALLTEYLFIYRAYFEHENRVFQTIAEKKERLPDEEAFLRRTELSPFRGRVDEIRKIRSFLDSSQRYLAVNGAGGKGKTRLIIEAGEEIAAEGKWQVFWANAESMANNAAWFEAIVPEIPTLLLIDDPSDGRVLGVLAEQIGGRMGRMSQWKVAIAVRSPQDPAIGLLQSPKMKPQVQELLLDSLPPRDAEAMCMGLFKAGSLSTLPEARLIELSRSLSRQFSGHPVWLTLAVHLLEEYGDLKLVPATAEALADFYLSEIVERQRRFSADSVTSVLRWVAIIGPVNRENEDILEMIATAGSLSSTDTKVLLNSLVVSKGLVQRGARNRLVEIKPDVLRDHILLGWLSQDVGFGDEPLMASDAARELVDDMGRRMATGQVGLVAESILSSLARVDYLIGLSGRRLRLMSGFFDRVRCSIPELTAHQRKGLVRALGNMAFFQPAETAMTFAELRTASPPVESGSTPAGPRVFSQEDVICSLAWPLAEAAAGAQTEDAQTSILKELITLVGLEVDMPTKSLAPKGQRAADLIQKVLEGGPNFFCDYDRVVADAGSDLIAAVSRTPPLASERALFPALIHPALAVVRHVNWFDGAELHMQRTAFGVGHPGWAPRLELLSKISIALESEQTPFESRILLWDAFAEGHLHLKSLYRELKTEGIFSIEENGRVIDRRPGSHRPASQRAGASQFPTRGSLRRIYHDLLLSDLRWSLQLLERRKAQFVELSAARKVWSWHHDYQTNVILKEAAGRLEALYDANDLAREFEPILTWINSDQMKQKVEAKAIVLAGSTAPEQISEFVARGLQFVGEGNIQRLRDVALSLGKVADGNAVVEQYVAIKLSQEGVSTESDFVSAIAMAWFSSIWKSENQERALELALRLLAACGSDAQRAYLLIRIYNRVAWTMEPAPTESERILFRSKRDLFVATGWQANFIGALAASLKFDWGSVKTLIEELLKGASPVQLTAALRAFIDGTFWAVQSSTAEELPDGLNVWIMDLVNLLPDLTPIWSEAEFHLGQIFDRTGRVPLNWLPPALRLRQKAELNRQGSVKYRAVRGEARISRFVEQVSESAGKEDDCIHAINEILEFRTDRGTIGQNLPAILVDIDPAGHAVPRAIVAILPGIEGEAEVLGLASLAVAYAIGSRPWREIAKAAITTAPRGNPSFRTALCESLGLVRLNSWTTSVGEVPQEIVEAVERARTSLNAELDPDLREFWLWQIDYSSARLRDHEEQAKEDRGE